MLLTIKAYQLDSYSFSLYNSTNIEDYNAQGVNWQSFTSVILSVSTGDMTPVTLDISARYQYMFSTTGLKVTFEDLGISDFEGLLYFPDGLYDIRVDYVYASNPYFSECKADFHEKIRYVIYNQLATVRWEWEADIECDCDPNADCGHKKYDTILRKYNYLQQLEEAFALELYEKYNTILSALYKLTQTTDEVTPEPFIV